MSLVPTSLRKWNVTPSRARRPDRVVMLITPLAAREPYSEAAAAPFTTSTLSMSSGLMSGSPPLTIMPSTMYSGSWHDRQRGAAGHQPRGHRQRRGGEG